MTQQMFDVRGKRVFLASDRGTEAETVPPGIYSIEFSPMVGWYLEATAMPSRPPKLYGDVADRATRILSTYEDRLSQSGKNTGVILTGNKGSGKTMLTAEVAVASVEAGHIVLVMNEAITEPSFFKFLNTITQPCVVLIDEFEKKYNDEEKQNSLLGLLDGINAGGKLFALTSNSANISSFLLSRPSRIFYHYRYEKLDEATVIGYCEDRLSEEAKHQMNNIKTLWDFSLDFSFDVLQCLVEELNRYPDVSFIDCLKVLNIQVTGLLERTFITTSMLLDGQDITRAQGYPIKVNIVDFMDGKFIPVLPASIEEDQYEIINKLLDEKQIYHHNHSYLEAKAKGKLNESDSCWYDEDMQLRLMFDAQTTTATAESIRINVESGGHSLNISLDVSRRSSADEMYEKIFTN